VSWIFLDRVLSFLLQEATCLLCPTEVVDVLMSSVYVNKCLFGRLGCRGEGRIRNVKAVDFQARDHGGWGFATISKRPRLPK
jgi:hypothetical protein